MPSQFVELVNGWLYGVNVMLRRRLENLKEDLASEDKATNRHATKEASQILAWLMPPSCRISDTDKLRRIEAHLSDGGLSTEKQQLASIRRAVRATGRTRGRPRDETSQQAIRALTLRYATSLSWREIALEIRGCKHHRPKLERSCMPCGEAIRNAAMRLEAFLKEIGYDLPFPRGGELDEVSRQELLEVWGVNRKAPKTPEDNSANLSPP